MALAGQIIRIPKRDQWDGVEWRILAIDRGGPFEQLVLRLRAQGRAAAIDAAMRRAARLMGATSLKIKSRHGRTHFDDITLNAAFPDTVDRWHKAHRRHMNKRIGDKRELPAAAYYRGYWTPVSDDIMWREPYTRTELEPGTWRLGGLGQHQRVQHSADYRLFRVIWTRRDWQARLAAAYEHGQRMAAPSLTRDEARERRYRPRERPELVRIPGRKGWHLRVWLHERENGQTQMFVPQGCRLLRRTALYRACDQF